MCCKSVLSLTRCIRDRIAMQVELADHELEELRDALNTDDPEPVRRIAFLSEGTSFPTYLTQSHLLQMAVDTQTMRRLGVSPVDMPKAWDPAEGVRVVACNMTPSVLLANYLTCSRL